MAKHALTTRIPAARRTAPAPGGAAPSKRSDARRVVLPLGAPSAVLARVITLLIAELDRREARWVDMEPETDLSADDFGEEDGTTSFTPPSDSGCNLVFARRVGAEVVGSGGAS